MCNSTATRKILIVEPQPLVSAGLKVALESNSQNTVVGTVDTASLALEFLKQTQPEMLITEFRLASENGIELIGQVHRKFPAIKLVVLTATEEWLHCEQALVAGASGFLGKSSSPAAIADDIDGIFSGKIVVSDEIQQCLFSRLATANSSGEPNGISQLSKRELQVFEMMGSGMSTREIAEKLDLSTKTIDTYRDKLKQKLNLESTAKLNRTAFEWSFSNT